MIPPAPDGVPEKSAPCGQADPGATPVATNAVTAFAPGDTVSITIMEVVPHPGHYRVALSTTGQTGLPGDPVVLGGPLAGLRLAGTTVTGSGPTGRTVTLGLSFLFGSGAGNRQLDVLAAGADDFGNVDPLVPVGRIHVKAHENSFLRRGCH